ncbi:MAG: SurA N-terminal domain-containing protein [Pseudomonadota bacterium]
MTIMLATLALAGCNGSGSSTSTSALQQPAPTEPTVVGAPQMATINKRGGTRIAVLVNDTPITSNDIARRAKFVRLRRIKGNATTVATNELIDEAIKMKEARRIGAVASDAEVDAAYGRFAKGNRLSQSQLAQVLNRSGTTVRGFKEYIRASLSWQRAVGGRMRAEASGSGGTAQKSKGPRFLSPKGTQGEKEGEYTLQQIIFVVPSDKRGQLSARRAQATRFRGQLNGCTNARQLAQSVRDVSVRDRGRLLESQLPPQWAKEIKATAQGGVTRTKDTERGVEMLVVCRKREVQAATSASSADLFGGENFEEQQSATEKKYLAELKERATIVRR